MIQWNCLMGWSTVKKGYFKVCKNINGFITFLCSKNPMPRQAFEKKGLDIDVVQ